MVESAHMGTVSTTLGNHSLTIGLLADFNTQNFAALLRKTAGSGAVNCIEGPFGQTARLLLDSSDLFWAQPKDAVLVWTLPELAVPEFGRVLAFEEFSTSDLLREVDVFCSLIKRIPATVRTILVPTWSLAAGERGLGPMDLADGAGVANAILRMNLRLVEQLNGEARVILFESSRWHAGAPTVNPKLWYMSKTPFANAVFQEAARDVLGALDGISGKARKVLILDLDNTLWGGVLGDIGWSKLRLGGHDPVGEAYLDFQKQLKRLTRRGVVLALASKNEEATALEAIRQHPEMILKLEDFAVWRINWGDKAANIAELMAELNLGLDAAVFLDDSAFERGRVREALPQILVPELPPDPLLYPSFLATLRCFDHPHLSREDRCRTEMYVADRKRVAAQADFHSLEDWLKALDLTVRIEALNHANLERATQIFNKTNQMNLSTRRLTVSELFDWSKSPGRQLWVFRVTDKFGDYGLCGIASLVYDNDTARLLDFLLSCRVMGRGVEETMFATAAAAARELKCEELVAEYQPTPRNQPCLAWFKKHLPAGTAANTFSFPLSMPVKFPSHVQVMTEFGS